MPHIREGMYYVWERGKEPWEERDLIKWAKYMQTSNRQVEKTNIGHVVVSTVFLGINHNYSSRKNAPPLLFETLTFDYEPEIQERYETERDARLGHDEVVREVMLTVPVKLKNRSIRI